MKKDGVKELACRWDVIVARARAMDWGDTSVSSLALQCDLPWLHSARGDEPLSHFLRYDGEALSGLRGFGRKKMGWLCDIVEHALGGLPAKSMQAAAPEPPTPADPHEALIEWGVPRDFPCALIRLPVRILNYCEEQGISDLGQLLDDWTSPDLKHRSKIGSKTLRGMQDFVDSLCAKDLETASTFLPLDPSGRLSLGRALAMVAADLTDWKRTLLRRRLVGRMTLARSAEEYGVSRERVRQIEAEFLDEVRLQLGYFLEEGASVMEARTRGEDWPRHLQLEDRGEDTELIIGALEAVFGETPEEIARIENERASIESRFEELVTHPDLWFGGVPLAGFLKARVTEELRQRFCERVFSSSELRIDFVEGRVLPAKTDLRHTVMAMLAGKKEPMPLSRLMKLLHRTGYHPSLSTGALVRQRQPWCRDFGFPQEMIRWEK